jgi:hypothetical protein
MNLCVKTSPVLTRFAFTAGLLASSASSVCGEIAAEHAKGVCRSLRTCGRTA